MKPTPKDFKDLAWLLEQLGVRNPELRELVDEAGGYNNVLLAPFYKAVDENPEA